MFSFLCYSLLSVWQISSLEKNKIPNEQDTTLYSIIEENSFTLVLNDHKINGVDFFLKSALESEVLLFGENHGIKEIANFSQILYDTLSSNHSRVLVTEVGPATAHQVQNMMEEGTFRKFMSEGTNLHSVPFFFLEQEVPLLEKTLSSFPENENSVLWGIDQEFIAGAPVIIRRLEELAMTDQENKAVRKFKRKAFFNPFIIGMGSGNSLSELEAAFSESASLEAKRLTSQLVLSHKIYKEQMGGDVRWSNERREKLMMENFNYYVESYPGSLPPMFFKFGSYHLHKGRSPTVKEALGLKIDQWAKTKGLSTIAINVDAVSGETLDPLMGGKQEIPSIRYWTKSPFKALVKDKPVLFDLGPIKNHPEITKLSGRTQLMIKGYDYLVLFPVGTPQNFLDGTLVTHAYGIAIGVLVLLIMFSLLYLIYKWIKKIKQAKN